MIYDALPALKILVKGIILCTTVPYPTNIKIKITNLSEKYLSKKVYIKMRSIFLEILQLNIQSQLSF